MAEIKQIKLPNGTIYDIVDAAGIRGIHSASVNELEVVEENGVRVIKALVATQDDINEICGATIQVATLSEVAF